jgi:hypothetical protein
MFGPSGKPWKGNVKKRHTRIYYAGSAAALTAVNRCTEPKTAESPIRADTGVCEYSKASSHLLCHCRTHARRHIGRENSGPPVQIKQVHSSDNLQETSKK